MQVGTSLQHISPTTLKSHSTGEQIPQKLEHGHKCAQGNIPAEPRSKERLNWCAHLCTGVLGCYSHSTCGCGVPRASVSLGLQCGLLGMLSLCQTSCLPALPLWLWASVNHVHLCWEGLEHRPLQNKHSSHQTMVPTAPFSYPFLLPEQQLPPTTQWSQCWQWLQHPQGRSHTALG